MRKNTMISEPQHPPAPGGLVASRHVIKLLIDPESGGLLDFSQAAADFYGLSRVDAPRRCSAWDLTPLGNRAETLRMLAAFAAGRDLGVPTDARHRRHDGAVREVILVPDLVEHDGRVSILATVIDVTERVRQEEALAAARAAEVRTLAARVQLANEAAGVGVWDWNAATGAVYYSPGYARMLGFTQDELAPHLDTWLDLLHPEERADVLVRAQHPMGNSGYRELEFRMRTKAGGYRWVLSRGQVVERATDGTPLRVVGTHVDITERKETELELRRYRQIVEVSTEKLLFIEPDLCYRVVNPAYAAMFLYTPEAMQGRALAQAQPPALWERLRPHLEAVLTGASERFRIEASYPDGHTRYIEAELCPFWEGSQVQGIIASLHDLTEMRAAQAALEAERAHLEERVAQRAGELATIAERLQLATEAAGMGVWEMDLKTGEIVWDAQLRELYGMPQAAAVLPYQSWLDWVEPADRAPIQASYERLLRGEDTDHQVVFRVRPPDGKERFIASRARQRREAPGIPGRLIGVSWDVTEERRAAAALREARDAAEEATHAKSEFLAHMSHELRTPMNSVLGLMQVLERTALDPDQRAMVAQVRTAGRLLLGILDGILDLSKIEAGQLALDARPFVLVPLLDALRELFGATARGKGLAFGITPPTLDGGLLGDPLRLEQVLANLIGNAVKFTDRGEVHVGITTMECTAERVRLRFEVADTGIGLTPQALAGLFRPFTQADASITRRFGGTGLGLSICKRLVELMGGCIGAESRAGEGSTFWFELPFEVAPASSRRESAAHRLDASTSDRLEAGPTGPRLPRVRLLVVDDSAMNQEVAQRMLALEGAQIALAADGREGLERLRAAPHGFDAVLMDVQMPVMDGLTATRLIRTELGLCGLPVIALTAGVSQSEQETALAAGMNDVLTKPLDLERMVALLLRWVRPGPEALAAAPGEPPQGARDPAEAFPEIPGIDRARVAERLAGNRALFLELLEHFADDFADVAAAIHHDLTAADPQTAVRRLHTLKGNAGTLGALDIMEAAAWLEGAIRRGEGGLDERLGALDAAIGELIAASAPWRGALIPPPVSPGAVSALDAGLLARFRESLRMQDMGAFDAFEALRQPLRDALGEAGCDALGRAIHNLEFAEALALLDQARTP